MAGAPQTIDDSLIDPVLLVQSAAANPAHKAPPKKPAASWSLESETALVAFLVRSKAQAGDGCSFKKATFVAAAIEVNKIVEKGGRKTWESCKSKFQKLKTLFLLICEIIKNSGWTWTDEGGACIDAGSAGVWDAWIKKNGAAKPFRNAGWAHLDNFRILLPEANARGTHVFRPHTYAAPGQETILSSQTDQDDEEDDYDPRAGSVPWDIEDKDGDGNGENSDEEKENEVPQTPAPPTSRKRSAAAPASAATTTKKVRLSSGAAALQNMASQVADFNDLMRDAFAPSKPGIAAPASPSSVQLQAAIKRARELETWMDPEDLVSLIEVFHDGKSVTIYEMLADSEELRIRWIKRKVGIME